MERSNRTYALVVPFVEALAALGLQHVCITPGSRNTPLSMTFASHRGISDWSHHDERSASFFALGLAKTTGRPVALACTSGTAAAEYLPAAVEARHARVPLLLLTADRPPELRDVGAPQAIDQVGMYGRAVKWSHEVAPAEATDRLVAYMTALAGRAWATATEEPPGPVHLNFPFREPLVPDEVPGDVPEDLRRPEPPRHLPGRLHPDERRLAEVADLLQDRRTLVVCGPVEQTDLAPAAVSLAAALEAPLFADPLSGLRAGTHDLSRVLGHGDLLARVGFLEHHPPEAVLRFGAPPTSKALDLWLADHPEIPQVVVDTAGWRDPSASGRLFLRADPVLAASALAKAVSGPSDESWATTWTDADRLAGRTLRESVEGAGYPSEPGVVLALGETLPAESLLWTASSMPVRDVDAFFPPTDRPIRFLANRGANGIDGFVSSGLGSATAGVGPTYLLAGDLSLVHDLTALGTAARLGIAVTIVVVDNDGGGVFSFLPQRRYPEHFERHFGTPHGLDLPALSEAFGVPAVRAEDPEILRAALAEPSPGPRLVHVRTDRDENVRIHEAAWEAAREVLDGR